MKYGYVITCQNASGYLGIVSDCKFCSYAEASDAMSERWQAMEEDGDGCKPVDYEIYEG